MKYANALASALLLSTYPSHAANVALIAHRAIYDVTLDHTTERGLLNAHGRMAIQVKNTCDGWSTAQRLIADMTDAKGVVTRTDYFVTAWESNDRRTMRFDVSNMRDDKPVSRERGSAALAADGAGQVELANGRSFTLPKGTEFPTAQIIDIVEAAEAGENSFKHIVFQGGGRSTVELSTVVIGNPADEKALSAEHATDKTGLLRGLAAWSVLISFFPLNAHIEQPDYEVATHLFANGIAGSMTLIYPSYSLKATLVRLEALYPSC
jgi:hypothetical protein